MIDSSRLGRDSKKSPKNPSATDDLDELRNLILAPEQAEIERLGKRIDNYRPSAEKIGELLPEAISNQTQKGERLTNSLLPSVEKAIQYSARRNPKVLVDCLFPVMGPAIRKAIAAAISSMVQSMNQSLQHSVSVQGLKWRMEAYRTGKSFGEIVMLHSLRYRVEQVFLIHRNGGLLLQHVTASGLPAEDPDMVSGMLTAIQDFVRDSFHAQQDEILNTMQVGEMTVWVEEGPYCLLAAVIRGAAPEELRNTMRESLEAIHLEQGEALETFEGDTKPFDSVRHHLESCLLFQYAEKTKRTSPILIALLILFVAAAGFWALTSFLQAQRWKNYVRSLNEVDGILVTEEGEQDGKYFISGLRDPLSTDPTTLLKQTGMKVDSVRSKWEPYQALSPSLILKRAQTLLKPPGSVSLQYANGILSASGTAPHAWISNARQIAPVIFGVQSWNDTKLINQDLARLTQRKARLEEMIVRFQYGKAELLTGEQKQFDIAIAELKALNEESDQVGLIPNVLIIGHADSEGAEEFNISLSRARAEFVRQALVFRGFPSASVRAEGVGSTKPIRKESTDEEKQFNRSVSFSIQFVNRSGREVS